ncbi:MAG TPA: VOC family protein [Candidatus Limnocylindrales bacterium]|jgi:catechol 2,3-dioxygenase-like lactoylglutathione lyase family enzyme|nr:VOC family protein [Candidatus Limnocylindrales bacterium]
MLASEKIIGFVPITDAARAKSFYAEKLGLKFVSEDPFAIVFDANGNMIRLTRMKEVKPQAFAILGWQVPDIVTTVQRLQAAGVKFERYGDFMQQDELGIWSAPGGSRVAWFKDPDGNTLSVSQH